LHAQSLLQAPFPMKAGEKHSYPCSVLAPVSRSSFVLRSGLWQGLCLLGEATFHRLRGNLPLSDRGSEASAAARFGSVKVFLVLGACTPVPSSGTGRDAIASPARQWQQGTGSHSQGWCRVWRTSLMSR